jgi:hypothetical protein
MPKPPTLRFTLPWTAYEGARVAPPEAQPRDPRRGRSVLSDAPPLTYIENAGTPIEIDCFKIDGLYRHLADCPLTIPGVLGFVRKYGLLRARKRESFELICGEIRAMRSLVAAMDRGNWPALNDWARQNEAVVRTSAVLHFEPDRWRPYLFFQPRDLIGAAYLQLLSNASDDAQLRQCALPGCGTWFVYGPGHKHRETARYCSPTCQKAHAYLKTKEV